MSTPDSSALSTSRVTTTEDGYTTHGCLSVFDNLTAFANAMTVPPKDGEDIDDLSSARIRRQTSPARARSDEPTAFKNSDVRDLRPEVADLGYAEAMSNCTEEQFGMDDDDEVILLNMSRNQGRQQCSLSGVIEFHSEFANEQSHEISTLAPENLPSTGFRRPTGSPSLLCEDALKSMLDESVRKRSAHSRVRDKLRQGSARRKEKSANLDMDHLQNVATLYYHSSFASSDEDDSSDVNFSF